MGLQVEEARCAVGRELQRWAWGREAWGEEAPAGGPVDPGAAEEHVLPAPARRLHVVVENPGGQGSAK